MSSTSISTLQEIAVMKATVLLCNDKEINQWSKFVPDTIAEWSNLLNSKISKLFLPDILHEKILAVASRVCLFIGKLDAVHNKICRPCHCQCLNGILQRNLFRTSDGLFDEIKTVKVLVGDQRIDLAFRFALASEYMMENCMRGLWKQMENDTKLTFSEGNWPANQKIATYLMLLQELHNVRGPFFSSWKKIREECEFNNVQHLLLSLKDREKSFVHETNYFNRKRKYK
ncbi:hypothetical protein AVEN_228293-1 [Araneus ventricosus]|uniref:Uncharacterized protein n=1 Tax=Araneus ventricosus TaxID=182803 RepID=A0A4Y2IGL5_ARAVE|nr:hypothetical protein AVEN_228293-1 [Araneus ventricosus]